MVLLAGMGSVSFSSSNFPAFDCEVEDEEIWLRLR